MTAPDEIGQQLPQPDPLRGWLVFDHLPDHLQRAEDTTRMADSGGVNTGHALSHVGIGVVTSRRVRPVTGTEILLLEHLGHDTTHVTQTVVAGRHRSWPCLESTRRTTQQAKALRDAGYTDPIPQ